MKLSISYDKTVNKHYRWRIDNKAISGSPPIGFGSTLREAIGDYVCNNIKMLGIELEWTDEALDQHDKWIKKELKKR